MQTNKRRTGVWGTRGTTAGVILAWLSIICAFPPNASAQWLQALRGEVREVPADPMQSSEPLPTRDPETNRTAPRHHHDDCDDEDGLFDDLPAMFFIAAITSPVWIPIGLAGDEYSQPSYFAVAPYHQGHNGLMVREDDLLQKKVASGYPMMSRIRAEFSHDLDDLQQTQLHALLESHKRFGVDGSVVYRHESLAGANDELLTGDLNLLFRFAQSPRLQMRAGAGVNWLSDDAGTEAGFNFTYGGDFYIAKPWVLSAEIDAGSLGDSGLFHFRTTIGLIVRGAEIYTGYDRYDVDNLETNQWVAGVGFWF